jgi:hypothetical protein
VRRVLVRSLEGEEPVLAREPHMERVEVPRHHDGGDRRVGAPLHEQVERGADLLRPDERLGGLDEEDELRLVPLLVEEPLERVLDHGAPGHVVSRQLGRAQERRLGAGRARDRGDLLVVGGDHHPIDAAAGRDRAQHVLDQRPPGQRANVLARDRARAATRWDER